MISRDTASTNLMDAALDVVNHHIIDPQVRDGYRRALSAPARLHQMVIASRDGMAVGFATWAYLTPESLRIFVAGKPTLLDIGDWNEGHIAMIAHFMSLDSATTRTLRRLLEASELGNAEALCWLRPGRKGSSRRLTFLGAGFDDSLTDQEQGVA